MAVDKTKNFRKVLNEGPYRVVVSRRGCKTCKHGTLYDVVHDEDGEELAESVTYENEEDAEDLASCMNAAYALGVRQSVRLPLKKRAKA